MRWLFADSNVPEEAAHVARTQAAIDRWWQAFQGKTSDLSALFSRRSDWDLPQWMADHLGAIHPQIMWEYGPAVRQPGHRLVITPESQRGLRPVVRTILQKAPKIAGWEFYGYRLPEDVPHTIEMVEARVGVNITGAVVDAAVGPGRKIDVLFAFPGQPGIDERMAMNAAFVATETLLGEQVLDTWIGGIGLLDGENGSGNRPLPLDRAQATVRALIESIQEQLPSVRTKDIGIEEAAWSSLELRPQEADDYAARDDLWLATTTNVEMYQAAVRGFPFASACHSRVGEWFCYLKLDANDVPAEERVPFRSQFEDALNPELLAAGVGCCSGSGTGLRYSYIDLALTDIAKAVPVIRRVLAERRAPLRSWLLFLDSDLEAEWVGVYADTPPPPTRSDEQA